LARYAHQLTGPWRGTTVRAGLASGADHRDFEVVAACQLETPVPLRVRSASEAS